MNSVNHNKLLKSIPCVQISHVTKRFGEDLVLKEVNLDLNYGQVYGIVGNNGSGKTVLMKCICGFLPATTGTIHVSGKQIGKDTDFPESLGVIIETPGFLTQYTGMKKSGNSGKYAETELQGRYPPYSSKSRPGSRYEKTGWKVFAWNAPASWNRSGHYGGSPSSHFG